MSRRAWLRAGADRAFAVVFGDRRGALVFLVAVAAAALLWRNVVSINDNYTVANGLVAVSRGHVAVLEPTFGDTLASPGMVHGADGIVARNYAHIVLALPALWLLQAVAAIADLRLALAGAWCLSLLAIVLLVGRLIGRKRLARTGGAALAFAVFAVSTALATPLEYPHLAFLALQLTTILIAGLSATLLYRVLCRLHDARTGLTAGLAVALASPGLLWASIPKRHVLTAGFALATLYLLVRSRDADTTARARRFRALAYAPVGLTAWLNAAEGFVLLFTLVAVDAVTAREHGWRTLATVAGAFAVSLVPLFVTNAVVAGDPLTVPRMLPPADGGGGGDIRFVGEIGDGGLSSGSGSGGTSGGTGGSGAGSGSSGGILVGIIAVWQSLVSTLLTVSMVVFEPVLDVLQRVGVFASFLSRGVDAATSDPSKIYHTFVRSGHVGTSGRGATGLAINLTLLESLPLAGVAVALPTVARRWRRSAELDSLAAVRAHLATPARTADLFVLAYAILLTLLYLRRSPIHATLTVRYIYPLFPLAVYAAARLPAVRAVVHERATLLGFVYAGGVLVGGQLTLAVVVANGYAVDEAMQGYALLGLVTASLLAGWATAAAFDHLSSRLGAVLCGVAGALSTNLMGLVAFYYFGDAFVLPVVPL